MKKSLLIASLLAATSIGASAVPAALNLPKTASPNKAITLDELKDFGTIIRAPETKNATAIRLNNSTRAEDNQTGKMVLTFAYPDSVKLGKFDLFSDAANYNVQVGATSKGGTIQIPTGTYTAVVIYYHYTKGATGKYNNLAGLSFVMQENVAVTAGGEVPVKFDDADATNEYKVHNILPNGEEAYLPDYEYTSKTDYSVAKEGNALYIGAYTFLFHKKYGQLEWISVASKGNILPNSFRNHSDISTFLKLRINDISDDNIIGMESCVNTGTSSKDKIDYFIEHFELPSVVKAKGEFRNDPNNFSLYKLPVVQTEPGRLSEYQTTMGEYSGEFDKYINGRHVGGMNMIAKDVQLCQPKAADRIPGFLTVIGYSFTDMVYKTEQSGNMYYEYSYPTAMNSMYDDANDNRVYMQQTWASCYAAQQPSNLEDYTHPAVRCLASDIQAPLGSSPVYISMLNTLEPDPYSDEPTLQLGVSPSHKGYASENISTYYYLNQFSGKFNGVTVELGPNPWEERKNETIDEWIAYDWNGNGKIHGNCEFTFSTAPFHLDGQACNTTAEISFDSSKDDFVCPAVQYLQFRNKEGKVNHRFEYPVQEAAMYLVAGDFAKKDAGVYGPASTLKTMKVQYKHHDDAEFGDMALEELGSEPTMPYFAPAYKVSLDQINVSGKQGWFDLLIELEDESGNRIRQTIAPAFYAGEDSGVNGVVDSTFAVRVMGNEVEILGEDAADIRVFSATGSPVLDKIAKNVSLNGLAHGVYILDVTANGQRKTIKTVIK